MDEERKVFRAFVNVPQSAADTGEAGEPPGRSVIGTSQGVDVLATSYSQAIGKICDHFGCKDLDIESIQMAPYPVLVCPTQQCSPPVEQ